MASFNSLSFAICYGMPASKAFFCYYFIGYLTSTAVYFSGDMTVVFYIDSVTKY